MTTQALPSFDAEYARVLKAADSAQALAHDREAMINAANAALDAAGVARDLPLAGRVAALVGERDKWIHERQTICDILSADPRTIAGDTLVQATKRVSTSDLAALQAQYEETQCQLAELTHLVGAETPITAFDLATTWQTERKLMQEEIEGLKRDVASWERTANGDERT